MKTRPGFFYEEEDKVTKAYGCSYEEEAEVYDEENKVFLLLLQKAKVLL